VIAGAVVDADRDTTPTYTSDDATRVVRVLVVRLPVVWIFVVPRTRPVMSTPEVANPTPTLRVDAVHVLTTAAAVMSPELRAFPNRYDPRTFAAE